MECTIAYSDKFVAMDISSTFVVIRLLWAPSVDNTINYVRALKKISVAPQARSRART
jgi:hypothetical protein